LIRPRPLLLFGILAATVGAACSGGGKQSPPPAGYVGNFQIARYLTYLPGAAPSPFLYADARFTGGGHYLDAGPSASYSGAGVTLPLTRLSFGGQIFYQKDPATGDLPLSDWVADSDYALTIAGSRLNGGVPAFTLDGAITTPAAFSLTGPDLSSGQVILSSSSRPTFTWTPGDGDYVLVIIGTVSSSLQVTQVEHKVDDASGSFTPTTIDLTQLALGTGSITLMRTIEHSSLALPDGGMGDGIGGDAVTCRLVRQ